MVVFRLNWTFFISLSLVGHLLLLWLISWQNINPAIPNFLDKPQSNKAIKVNLIDSVKPIVMQKRSNNIIPEDVDAYSEKNNQTSKKTRGQKGASQSGRNGHKKGTITSLKDLSLTGMGDIPQSVLDAAQQAQGEAAYEGSDLETQLNTKEHVYYGYFARIKVRLDNVWQLSVRDKIKELYDRRIISLVDDKVTRVIIVLTNKGHLHKVQIILPSGVEDLDDTAVDAFRQAEPFPNPPSGLIESDGFIRLTWSFIVDFD